MRKKTGLECKSLFAEKNVYAIKQVHDRINFELNERNAA